MTKTGIELIAAEREKQIKKGWTPMHDVEHEKDGSLSKFAGCLLGEQAGWASPWGCCEDVPEHLEELAEKVMEKPWIERLIVAGAMIAAEIDRLSFVVESPAFVEYRRQVMAHMVGVRKVKIYARHEDAILTIFDSGMDVSWCIGELLDCEFDEAH